MMKWLCQSMALVGLLVLSACFGGGIDKTGSVLGYEQGVVQTKGGSFAVGRLPAQWRQTDFSYKALLFQNIQAPAGISVSSFCGTSFDDAPLDVLSNRILYDLTSQKILIQRKVTLDGREALRVAKKGYLDGAPVVVDVVTLKMNTCVFDFVLSTDEGSYQKVVKDFEIFYNGFDYISGPKI